MQRFLELISVLLIVIAFFMLQCIQGAEINNIKKELSKVQQQNYLLTNELEETEDRCRRMTDTCIDILSNQRW